MHFRDRRIEKNHLFTVFHDFFNNINHILITQGMAIGNILWIFAP